jgi:hypothetical protein
MRSCGTNRSSIPLIAPMALKSTLGDATILKSTACRPNGMTAPLYRNFPKGDELSVYSSRFREPLLS